MIYWVSSAIIASTSDYMRPVHRFFRIGCVFDFQLRRVFRRLVAVVGAVLLHSQDILPQLA